MKYVITAMVVIAIIFCIALMNVSGSESELERRMFGEDIDGLNETEGDEFNDEENT